MQPNVMRALAPTGEPVALSRRVRRRLHITGIVQGVGFRPFVYALATRLDLAGCVTNDMHGVLVEVEGDIAAVTEFLTRVFTEAPPLAVIDNLSTAAIAPEHTAGFAIVDSRAEGAPRALISPDVATCDDCLREIFDPGDRRYHYPFTNCTNCGPRFTITCGVPYDRRLTTMAEFGMCADCAREYRDPKQRRFHAQPISCPACGPRLRLIDRCGAAADSDPLDRASDFLRAGCIVAVKGLGGYHLAVIAANDAAVATLRARKHREDKPFAVMVRDLDAARRLAQLDAAEERLLAGAQRPIVLARKRPDAPLAAAVAPGNRCVGLMLPYTPLHHLLCSALGEPLVLTSGNVSDEPIAYTDDDARGRLRAIADLFLTHDRAIHTRTDDSVVRVFRGRALPLRRSRGHVPQPLLLPAAIRRPILACGAELKSTFCLAKDRYAFLSPHIGDLEHYATLRAFTEGIDLFKRLFDISPAIVAYDLHPEYLSTKFALGLENVELVGVQHHHAHIAACLADNGHTGPVIGVAFDGLGYGPDGTLWGGEFLVANLRQFERLGHFEAVPMPGGTSAIKQPWRMAAAYLDRAYNGAVPDDLPIAQRHTLGWAAVVELARTGTHAPLTSSVGRLFDALAAMLGIRDVANYEGQAAVELEQCADPAERFGYPIGVEGTEPLRVRGADLIRAAADDLRAGTSPATIAARIHNALARVITEVCSTIRRRRGLSTVALSGGVFQNMLLLERAVQRLEARGFRVLTHRHVPPNDGGISFGQAVVAAAGDVLNRAGSAVAHGRTALQG